MKYILIFLIGMYSLIWNKEFYTSKGFSEQERVKNQAFKVLQTKCNLCHSTKKRVDVFTFQNMDSLATDINQQVFIKRKMPKGRKFNLTAVEEQALKDWIVLVGN